MKSERVAQLVRIAEAVRDRDLAQLAAYQDQLEDAKNARASFDQQVQKEDQHAVEHLGYRRGHELARREWRERQLYALTHYAARAAAQAETQKRTAAKSLGRALVLEQLRLEVLKRK